jgi:integrase
MSNPKQKRRDRGIFERPKDSGIWWIRYADQFGKLHREKVGPKSLARAAYRKRKTEIREGKFFPETIRRRREILFRDTTPLSNITKLDVERFRSVLAKELAPATVNRHIALLKSIFNKAISWGKSEHNPVRGIKLFKETHRIRFLSDEEEEHLNTIFPPKYWPWVEFALHTGLRREEQFGLRWENVDFGTDIITIPQSKSGEIRYVSMNDRVVETHLPAACTASRHPQLPLARSASHLRQPPCNGGHRPTHRPRTLGPQNHYHDNKVRAPLPRPQEGRRPAPRKT